MNAKTNRRVVPVPEAFFNDGYWYVLTSTSLGGSGLTAASLAGRLQSNDPSDILDLADRGICLPLYFDGDCALDDAVIVVGDLNEREQDEWFGRICGHLQIPCGEFLLMGGGLEEDLEIALAHDVAPDPHFVFFHKLKLAPGSYLVEVYAFLHSMSWSIIWEKAQGKDGAVARWRTEGGEFPEWLTSFLANEYVDINDFDLQDYVIRLSPLKEKPPLPTPTPEIHWFGEFEVRIPERFPRGVFRSSLLAEADEGGGRNDG